MPLVVNTRPRTSWSIKRILPFYGEYLHEGIHLFIGCSAFTANFGFFEDAQPDYYAFGNWAFFWNNVIEILLGLHGMHETHEHRKTLPPGAERGALSHEIREGICFVLGSACFSTGSILFLPGIMKQFDDTRNELTAGGALFIIGSFMFMLGSYVNSLSMSYVGAIEQQTREVQLAAVILGFNIFGAACYFAGSFNYLPQVESEDCETVAEYGPLNMGTLAFVFGAGFFLFAKILRVYLAYRKHNQHERESATSKDVQVEMKAAPAAAPADEQGGGCVIS